ncbi:hypothetical protein [Frankia sp. AvcI1]|uniref:hypothetical protein n=1 Tax=Frankia sp. AvcI1 TaxID=573496 RepID=UPI001F1EFA8A|nr:hypothetical protein [Frankia sp. AvcI1]
MTGEMPLPGMLAVARRRALLAESDLVHLAYAGADVATLTAVRVLVDERFATLAGLEAAADAAGSPARPVLIDRLLFARERVKALVAPPGRPAHPVLLGRIQLAVADAGHRLLVFLASDGAPVDDELVGLDADQVRISSEIDQSLWDEAIAAAGGLDGE